MEVRIVKQKEDSVLVEIPGESFTLTSMMVDELWEDENVLEAAQIREHPYLEEPKIFVRVKKGNPLEALEKAAERLIEKLKGISMEFKKFL